MTYRALNETTIIGYIAGRPGLAGVFSDFDHLSVSEVGDGNLNLVFIVENTANPTESVVLKQALPFLRVAGDSWPLTRERMRYETQALLKHNELAPGLVPVVYDFDDEMSIVVMEHLKRHEIMRKSLVARLVFPKFVDHITTFLVNSLFFTSDLYLTGPEKAPGSEIRQRQCASSRRFCIHQSVEECPEPLESSGRRCGAGRARQPGLENGNR
jgi:5-methylthioribose kinase